jgi:hypothetical protein
MKMIRQGKEYDYDYKQILVKGKYHKSLQTLSKKEDLPMGKMIQKLVEHYENSNR